MRKKTLLGLIFLIALTASVSTLFYYSFFVIDAVVKIPMDVQVGGHPGFNVNNDSFHFGQVVAPGAGWRETTISNSRPYPLYVAATASGEIQPWVIISPNNFVLQPGETKTMVFRVEIADGTPYGNYTGMAKIVFEKKQISER